MTEPLLRLAGPADVAELVRLRRAFTFEDPDAEAAGERPGYEAECSAFLDRAVADGSWRIWVAELGGRIVAHAYLALVSKVPRPTREHARIAYLTNVYTCPEHRGSGLGGQLLARVQADARAHDVELIVVWPAEESAAFYERHGYKAAGAPAIWHTGEAT